MHRLKGLECKKVLLVGVQEGTVPLVQSLPVADDELRERCLLYVACTRARDELVITGYGTKSPFLESNERWR
jgi:superfamily I DNA/RNA helicase